MMRYLCAGITGAAMFVAGAPAVHGATIAAQYEFKADTDLSHVPDLSGNNRTMWVKGEGLSLSTDVPDGAPSDARSLHFTDDSQGLTSRDNGANASALSGAAITQAGGLSFDLWAKSLSNDFSRFNNDALVTNGGFDSIRFHEDGEVRFTINGVGTVAADLPTDGKWHRYTGIYNLADDTLTLLIDGVIVAQEVMTGTVAVNDDPNRGLGVGNHPFTNINHAPDDTLIYNPTFYLGALALPVPEPASMLLVGCGATTLLTRRRRH